MAKKKGVILGAMMGALLGSVGAAVAPHRKKLLAELQNQQEGWAEKAKNLSEHVYDEMKKHWGHEDSNPEVGHFVKGAVMGMLVGAGSALLLTPKTGKQMRNKLNEQYQNAVTKTQDVIDYISEQPFVEKTAKVKNKLGTTIEKSLKSPTAKKNVKAVAKALKPKKR